MEEYMNGLLSAVLPSVLNKFRIYLTLLRFLDYNLSDDITKVHLVKQDSCYLLGFMQLTAVTC
jgi:hypothetical protein